MIGLDITWIGGFAMHTQQDSDAALQNNLTISEKSVIPYTHSSGYAIASLILGIISSALACDLQHSWNCFCHQGTKAGETLPEWSGHCRTDSLYLRFCVILVILDLLDLVSVCFPVHRGNKTTL